MSTLNDLEMCASKITLKVQCKNSHFLFKNVEFKLHVYGYSKIDYTRYKVF